MRYLLAVFLILFSWGLSHAAVLSLTSSQATGNVLAMGVGDTVTIRVTIDTEGEQVRGLECFVDLPDSVFLVIDADTSRDGVQPFVRGAFIKGGGYFQPALFGSESESGAGE